MKNPFSRMNRRQFLKTATLATTVALTSRPSQAKTRPPRRRPTGLNVAVLGGGVGGMTAAHELAERGFSVRVFEQNNLPGGKARSIPAQESATGGRLPLPGEHGFRFFPGFYTHLDDTMARIPFGSGNTLQNLVPPSHIGFGRIGQNELLVPTHLPHNAGDIQDALKVIMHADLGIPKDDMLFLTRRLLQLLGSCEERRFGEYEHISWWNFIEAEHRSENYRRFLASGIMRCLVACQPKKISTRTGGYTFLQLVLSIMGMNKAVDRVLNGPTNDQWLFPWLDHIKNLGVNYNFQSNVKQLYFNSQTNRIEGARIETEGHDQDIYADHFVLAVPVEVAIPLLTTEMKAADPALSRIENLKTEWMNGIQFFLTEDALEGLGHMIYFDSPWAVTSISQKQYWRDFDFSRYGNGQARAVLSVDVSDWNTPGILYGKPAKNCTKAEIIAEVWAQMKQHLNENQNILTDDKLVYVHLDPAIGFPAPGETTNKEPLLINTVSSWQDRPEAVTQIENLVLASDYVRTHMDLASMEAANEAARRGVNGILANTNYNGTRCLVDPLQEPSFFAPLKALDRIRYHRGLPFDQTMVDTLLRI